MVLPEKLTELQNRCFIDCTSLEKVYLPFNMNNIGSSVFSGCDKEKLTLYVYEDSMALTYAYNNNFKYAASVYDPYTECMYGDVDGDDLITSSDSLSILRASVGLEYFTNGQKKIADVDVNKKIDSADSLAVLRHIVGLKTTGCKTGTMPK